MRETTDTAVHVSRTATDVTPAALPSFHTASFGTRHRRGFIVAAIIGMLLTLVGALETGQIAFLPRLLYWEILMLSGAIIALGVTEALERWGRLRNRQWIALPLIAFCIALPMTLIVVGSTLIFFQTPPPGGVVLTSMFGITFVITMAMTLLNYMIHSQDKTASQTPVIAPIPDVQTQTGHRGIDFADRLPAPLRSLPVIALQAEDHYLRVYLGDGQSTLILMRLSDAIAELPTDLGTQTHRSWWVAPKAVRAATKGDGRATLTLDHGIEVPVSRSFYPVLNKAGWLG